MNDHAVDAMLYAWTVLKEKEDYIMIDMQTKQLIKYLANISKNLAGLNTGIAKLVEETRKQNQLTMAMIQAAEADDEEDIDDIDDDLETEDISAVEADDEEEGDIDDND